MPMMSESEIRAIRDDAEKVANELHAYAEDVIAGKEDKPPAFLAMMIATTGPMLDALVDDLNCVLGDTPKAVRRQESLRAVIDEIRGILIRMDRLRNQ